MAVSSSRATRWQDATRRIWSRAAVRCGRRTFLAQVNKAHRWCKGLSSSISGARRLGASAGPALERLAAAPRARRGGVEPPAPHVGRRGRRFGAVSWGSPCGGGELDHLLSAAPEVRASSGPSSCPRCSRAQVRAAAQWRSSSRHEADSGPRRRTPSVDSPPPVEASKRRRYLVSGSMPHMIHDVCQHDASPLSVSCAAHRKGACCDNTVMSHTTRAHRLLIRSAPGRRTGERRATSDSSF